MTPEQIALVQASFRNVVPIRDAAASLFYTRLFKLDPSLKPMFQNDMKQQGRKLMIAIATVVQGLNDLEEILPVIQDLGRRHASVGAAGKLLTVKW